jgi:hypothetical protein
MNATPTEPAIASHVNATSDIYFSSWSVLINEVLKTEVALVWVVTWDASIVAADCPGYRYGLMAPAWVRSSAW